MTRKKLAKLKQDLAALRRSQAKARDIQRLATKLGRKQKNRGKEPTWESQTFPSILPLTIPYHGGKDLAPGTKRNILDQIEQDVLGRGSCSSMKKARTKTETKMATGVADYLKRPYARVVVPEGDGTFRGEIVEFPGCIATGETEVEALSNLRSAAESWLLAVVARGQKVPEPMEGATGFSGKTVARLGSALHRRASYLAAADGISLNQFIVTSVAEKVGSRSAELRIASATHTTNFFVNSGGGRAQVVPKLSEKTVTSASRRSEFVNAGS